MALWRVRFEVTETREILVDADDAIKAKVAAEKAPYSVIKSVRGNTFTFPADLTPRVDNPRQDDPKSGRTTSGGDDVSKTVDQE